MGSTRAHGWMVIAFMSSSFSTCAHPSSCITISPKGYVQQASVSQTSLRNATVERCMTQKIRTWKFPEPKGGGIVIVNYPFIFKNQ